jgi:hypothetical protein
MCIYIVRSVLWCPLRFLHKIKDVRFGAIDGIDYHLCLNFLFMM